MCSSKKEFKISSGRGGIKQVIVRTGKIISTVWRE